MGATIRRKPITNKIPAAQKDYYENILGFKGIQITDNPFNTEEGSCADCCNVYVDKEWSLTTRPRIDILKDFTTDEDFINILNIYNLVDGYLIQTKSSFYRIWNITNNGYKKDIIYITEGIEYPTSKVTLFEQKKVIYMFTNKHYLCINIDSNSSDYHILKEVEGYIPTVRVGVTGEQAGIEYEDYNILTDKYKIEYAWSLSGDPSKMYNTDSDGTVVLDVTLPNETAINLDHDDFVVVNKTALENDILKIDKRKFLTGYFSDASYMSLEPITETEFFWVYNTFGTTPVGDLKRYQTPLYYKNEPITNRTGDSFKLYLNNIDRNFIKRTMGDNTYKYSLEGITTIPAPGESTTIDIAQDAEFTEPIETWITTDDWKNLDLHGEYVWTYNNITYYSEGSKQYYFDGVSNWNVQYWSSEGFTNIYGNKIWKWGNDVYYSDGDLNKTYRLTLGKWTDVTELIKGNKINDDFIIYGEDIWNNPYIRGGAPILSHGSSQYYLTEDDGVDYEAYIWKECNWKLGADSVSDDLNYLYGRYIYSVDQYSFYSWCSWKDDITQTWHCFRINPLEVYTLDYTGWQCDSTNLLFSGNQVYYYDNDYYVTIANETDNSIYKLGQTLEDCSFYKTVPKDLNGINVIVLNGKTYCLDDTDYVIKNPVAYCWNLGKKAVVLGSDHQLKYYYNFKSNDNSYTHDTNSITFKVSDSSSETLNVTNIMFDLNGYCCILLCSQNKEYYIYQDTITNLFESDFTSNNKTIFNIDGNIKIDNTSSLNWNIYDHAYYSYAQQKVLYNNILIDLTTGKIDFLYLGTTDFLAYSFDIETGLCIMPYSPSTNDTISDVDFKFIIYPNLYQSTNAAVVCDLSGLKITDELIFTKFYNNTVYRYGCYDAIRNNIHFMINYESSDGVRPLEIIIKAKTGSKPYTIYSIDDDNALYKKQQERKEIILKSKLTTRFYNQRWTASNGYIFYTSNNDPTYFPMSNFDTLGDAVHDITGFNLISDTGMVAYTKDQLSIITPIADRGDGNYDYAFTETKNTIGNIANEGCIVTSYTVAPLQIDKKGIFTIQQTENVVSEANIVIPITNTIQKKWSNENEIEKCKTANDLYWTYFFLPLRDKYNTDIVGSKVYVLDNRTTAWYYWELPIVVNTVFLKDDNINMIDPNGVIYTFKTDDIIVHEDLLNEEQTDHNMRVYYDTLKNEKKLIDWYWHSQIIPLGSVNYLKQLIDTTFIVDDDAGNDNYGLSYKFRCFRKNIYESDARDIEGDIQYVRSRTVRSLFTRINFLQLRLENRTDDYMGDYSRLRLVGLGFRYRILGANRP